MRPDKRSDHTGALFRREFFILRLGQRRVVWLRSFQIARIAVYAACVATAAFVWTDLLSRAREWIDEPAPKRSAKAMPQSRLAGRMITTEGNDSDWNRSLNQQRTWSSSPRRSTPDVSYPAQRSGLLNAPASPWAPWSTNQPKANDDEDTSSPWKQSRPAGTYRTVCVRLCDGYNWPISFSTTSENFERDSKICESSCSTAARLYVHQNPGQDPEEMADLKGKPYTSLSVAYRYRKELVPSCKCKPDPWDEVSLARHRAYAELEAKKKLGKAVESPVSPKSAKAAEAERRRIEALKRAGLHHEDGAMKAIREAANSKPKAPAQSATLATATVAAKVLPDSPTMTLTDGGTVRVMRLGVEPSAKQTKKSRSGKATTFKTQSTQSSRQSWAPPVYETR